MSLNRNIITKVWGHKVIMIKIWLPHKDKSQIAPAKYEKCQMTNILFSRPSEKVAMQSKLSLERTLSEI